MNDQHAHAGYAAPDGYSPGCFTAVPLFGAMPDGYEGRPDQTGSYDSAPWHAEGQSAHQQTAHGAYQAQQYGVSGEWPVTGSAQACHQQPVDHSGPAKQDVSGQWDATAWNQAHDLNGMSQAGQLGDSQSSAQQFSPEPTEQFGNAPKKAGQFGTGNFAAAQFTAETFTADGLGAPFADGQLTAAPYSYAATARLDAGQPQTAPYGYDATGRWPDAAPFDTAVYDATFWNSAQYISLLETLPEAERFTAEPETDHTSPHDPDADYPPAGPPSFGGIDAETGTGVSERLSGRADKSGDELPATHRSEQDAAPRNHGNPEFESGQDRPAPDRITPAVTGHPVRPGGGRSRRRAPARRSALLTVAVPSACVMGVAGIAAASVSGLGSGEEKRDQTTSLAAADLGSVKPVAANNAMDTQLAELSEDARDFGDRASRTQERIDLKARQEAEKKKRDADTARKEALRPKFVLPVTQRGLSAYFGQAGVNWMSVHTGIDFPVSYGTPVMSATDGVVRTQWNSSYGNMAIVTATDGTETWYCHLSSTKIRSGSVKAGEVIAHSGNSGNSTGPHLHFEVRPGGGSAINPLPWLRGHGLDPTA